MEAGPWNQDMNDHIVESDFQVNGQICSMRAPHHIKMATYGQVHHYSATMGCNLYNSKRVVVFI